MPSGVRLGLSGEGGGMDARHYLDEIVEPTIAEFEADPRSTRRAFLACVVAFHAIDYLTHPAAPGATRDQFRRESEAFAMVDRVAHAFKHVTTGDIRSPTVKPLASAQVKERPPAVAGLLRVGLSIAGDRTGGVVISGQGNPDILTAVKKAAVFLRSKLSPPNESASPPLG